MADRHAGFAAAAAIGQGALEELARALYLAGRFDRHLSATAPGVLSTHTVAFDDVFLDVPRFELLAANQGRAGLRLRAWGPVVVTPNDTQQPPERRDCTIDLLVRLPARAILVHPAAGSSAPPGRLVIQLDALTATVAALSIVPFDGSSFSSGNQAYLNSPALRTLLEIGVRANLAARGPLLPPLDASFLGAVVTDPSTTATLAVVDEAVVLGFDISTGGVTTTGDATQLTNFLGDRSIAMWINPAAVSVAFDMVRAGLAARVTAEGATLQSFSLTVEEGGLRVSGTAGRDEGTLSFSLLASPALVKLGDPERDRLSFVLSELQLGVTPSWWAVLLEVLSVFLAFGLVIAFVEMMSTMIRSNIINGIQLAGPSDAAPLTIHFMLPGVDSPLTLRIKAFECHAEGVFTGLDLAAEFRAPKIVGPTVLAAEEVPSLGMQPLVYRVDLGSAALIDDPALRIRWTVRAPGDGTALLTQDFPTSFLAAVTLVLWEASLPFLTQSSFRIECRVYRAFGSRAEEVMNDVLLLSVRDRLDRTHPYVRWTHRVLVPTVRREADGSRSVIGESIKTRHSKLHRTDIPGRCRMASHYSLSWMTRPTDGPGVTGPTLEYLDALPFPTTALLANRAQLCDYCFFGGPTKQVPLIP